MPDADIAAAHLRLASLPTTRHRKAEADATAVRRANAEKASRTKKLRGQVAIGLTVVLPGSRAAKSRRKT